MKFRKKMEAPFRKAAEKILGRIPVEKLVRNKKKLEMDLRAAGSRTGEISIHEYYTQKLTVVLTAAFWGVGLILLYAIVGGGDQPETRSLVRPGYGEEDRETELALYVQKDEEALSVPVRIQPRKMTQEQLEKFFEKTINQLEKTIPGANQTLDEVRADLNLESVFEMEEGSVLAEWYTDPEDLLDDTGKILRDVKEEGEMVQLRAVLKYQDQEMEYECWARVFPEHYTEEESIIKSAVEEVGKIDESTRYEEEIQLPAKIGEKSVRWGEEKGSEAAVLSLLLLVVLTAVFIGKDRELAKAASLRRQQLLLDYPGMVFKLTMLLGAGLTMRAAFEKTAGEGKSYPGEKTGYVYEEMQITCREMKSGIAETRAYENFGKRCQESVYIKFGSMLAQNLKKGSKGLIQLLENEAHMSLEERRAMVKKMGEEAGTKLLFPMLLMLIVVLVILMVPALMSF